jgi:hypothetical protein
MLKQRVAQVTVNSQGLRVTSQLNHCIGIVCFFLYKLVSLKLILYISVDR